MNLEERKEKFEDIYYNKIGMCGCGSPIEVKQFLFELLENHKQYIDDKISFEVMSEKRKTIIKNVNADLIFEFIFHMLGNAEILKHGGSIYGSWFTEEGLTFLKLLGEFKDELID